MKENITKYMRKSIIIGLLFVCLIDAVYYP